MYANGELLIWVEAGELLACFSMNSLPPELWLGSRQFLPLHGEDAWTGCLHWSGLRNSKGELVGISVHPVDDPEILRSAFLTQTKGVTLDGCCLDLVLCDADVANDDHTLGFPVVVYQDMDNNLIFGLGQFGDWGEVAFDVEVGG
jgi:hypothetical protein